MKKESTAKVVGSIIYIVIGAILIVYPTIVGQTICYILAGCAAAMGIIELISFVISTPNDRMLENKNDFLQGVILLVLAAFIITKQTLVIELVPFILGFMIMIKGLSGVQNTLNVRKIGSGNFNLNLIASTIVSIFGIVMMFNPFSTAKALFIMVGLGLVVSGLVDIILTIMVSRELKKFREEQNNQ